jgi:hypothetical protein
MPFSRRLRNLLSGAVERELDLVVIADESQLEKAAGPTTSCGHSPLSPLELPWSFSLC